MVTGAITVPVFVRAQSLFVGWRTGYKELLVSNDANQSWLNLGSLILSSRLLNHRLWSDNKTKARSARKVLHSPYASQWLLWLCADNPWHKHQIREKWRQVDELGEKGPMSQWIRSKEEMATTKTKAKISVHNAYYRKLQTLAMNKIRYRIIYRTNATMSSSLSLRCTLFSRQWTAVLNLIRCCPGCLLSMLRIPLNVERFWKPLFIFSCFLVHKSVPLPWKGKG